MSFPEKKHMLSLLLARSISKESKAYIPVKLSVKHRHLLFPSFHREKQFVRHDIFPGLPVWWEEGPIRFQKERLRQGWHEEIGVPEEKVSILGVLSDIYIPLSNFNITPIVGTTLQLPDFILSQDEVEKVILVKLRDLFDDRNKPHTLLYDTIIKLLHRDIRSERILFGEPLQWLLQN